MSSVVVIRAWKDEKIGVMRKFLITFFVLALGLGVGRLGVAGPVCANDNGDVNGDGVIDVTDSLYSLAFLFLGGPAPVPICCEGTDLSLTKTVDNATPQVGETIMYNVTLTNPNPTSATSITVSDVLPACLTFVSAQASAGTYNSISGEWQVPSIDPFTYMNMVIFATVTSSCDCIVTNTAEITASVPADSNPANNQASVDITTQCTDLSLTKTVDNATPQVGETIMYNVTLTNPNPMSATSITVSDVLPACLTFVSAQASAGTYNSISGEWQVPGINPFTYMNMVIFATVTSSCDCIVTNTAEITASVPADSNPANNQASVDFMGPCDSDFYISKFADVVSPDTFHYGSPESYLVKVGNGGPDPALTPIVVSDLLPLGLCYDSGVSPGTGWTCTASASLPGGCDDFVECTYDPTPAQWIAMNDTLPMLEIGVQVAPIQQWPGQTGGDMVTNCVRVEYAGDTNPTNDVSCVDQIITP